MGTAATAAAPAESERTAEPWQSRRLRGFGDRRIRVHAHPVRPDHRPGMGLKQESLAGGVHEVRRHGRGARHRARMLDNQREQRLDGEAREDVAADAEKPRDVVEQTVEVACLGYTQPRPERLEVAPLLILDPPEEGALMAGLGLLLDRALDLISAQRTADDPAEPAGVYPAVDSITGGVGGGGTRTALTLARPSRLAATLQDFPAVEFLGCHGAESTDGSGVSASVGATVGLGSRPAALTMSGTAGSHSIAWT